MRRNFIFALWIFLLGFVLASIYISFSAYLIDRDKKILANVATFLTAVQRGEEKVELPYPDYTLLVYLKRPNKKFVSTNAVTEIDRDKYTSVTLTLKGDVVYVYAKKVSLTDYLSYISGNNLYIGLLVAGFLLYMSVFYFTIREFEVSKGDRLTVELINKLKAFRLTLATFKVIPEESVEEMKKVVDSILGNKKEVR